MKVQSASNLPSNRSSFLPKKRSPRHADSGYQSASTSSSPSMSPTASTSAQPAAAAPRPALAPRASSSNPQRPPLRRSSAGTAVICDKSINQQIAFERELQNLMEVEYRDDVQEYMYDMEVRFCVLFFCSILSCFRVFSLEPLLPLNSLTNNLNYNGTCARIWSTFSSRFTNNTLFGRKRFTSPSISLTVMSQNASSSKSIIS